MLFDGSSLQMHGEAPAKGSPCHSYVRLGSTPPNGTCIFVNDMVFSKGRSASGFRLVPYE